jgi:glycosyltransferase involved in cell wall biosynthesis
MLDAEVQASGRTYMWGENELAATMIIGDVQSWSGGTQKQAVALASALQELGVPVDLLDMQHELWRLTGKKFLRFWPSSEIYGKVRVTHLPSLRLQPAWSFLISFLIWAIVHRRQFHIIHAHGAALGVIAALVGWLMHKKVVVKIPGMVALQYLQGSSLSQRVRRCLLLRRADCFIAVSSEMVQVLLSLGIRPEQIALIPNGVSLTEVHRAAALESLKDQLLGSSTVQVVLYVGRLAAVKGIDRLLTVWATLSKDENAVLLIVGDGPLREGLEATVQRLALHSRVKFLGPQAEVSMFYAIADLFVLPSRSEGMSNALLEAMAASIPSVASDVGGNREVITNAENGFLVNWEDTAACVDLLKALLADAPRRQVVGEAAKQRAGDFALPRVAERYRQLYQALLREGST